MSSAQDETASARWWRYATALSLTALACGLLLGGLSAWFLGSVAIAGLTAAAFTFNIHIPGALVRLFAIGRTVAKYGERLAGHKAALMDQVSHRVRLFGAMAATPAVRQTGWQLGDASQLADYLDDVEDVEFARLRSTMPSIAACCGLAACAAATLIVAPAALLPIALLLTAAAAAAVRVAKAGAIAWEQARSMQRNGTQRLGSAMASAVPLKAEGSWDDLTSAAVSALTEADHARLRIRHMQATLDAIVAMVAPAAAISVFAAAWLAGARSTELLIPVFVAFAWLALGEALQGTSRALVALLRKRSARRALNRWAVAAPRPASVQAASIRPGSMSHEGLGRQTPNGRAIGKPMPIALEVGRPTVLAGTSGAGKTSLLKQLAGWIGNDQLAGADGPIGPGERQEISAFCPHDAVIIADTFRANLLAANAGDEEMHAALAAVEMTERVERGGGLDAWITQDKLSLGEAQRINLARAWLSDRPVILLDEPTEHLDQDQGRRVLERLLIRLNDRIVVFSSHRPPTIEGLNHITL